MRSRISRCPQDSAQIETLDKNLEAYKAAGYNAVLLTFDLTEPLGKLLDVISFVKSKDMRVVFAYAGPERLEWSVFQDPDKIADYLSSIGAASDAFLIGWRRTSLHLLIPDPQWINFLVKNARKCNQDLPVIGEAYLGQTAESNESERAVTYNIPENISAVLIFGMATGLYSFLGLIGKSFVVDGVIESINQRKVCTVVTSNPEDVTEYILEELHRSATIEEAQGAYTGKDLTVVMTVLTRREATLLRNFLRMNDNHAFITIVNSSEIIGKGFRAV